LFSLVLVLVSVASLSYKAVIETSHSSYWRAQRAGAAYPFFL